MADYVVRFTGQDNLSGTISQINSELREVGNNSSQLDRIMDRFNRIDQSAAPLKKKLRDLQAIMAQMNMDGLANTQEFTMIAEKAGAIKDAIADAAQAVREYSDDTFRLQAGIQAMQGVAAAASVATGVMGLLGTENKKVEQAILKVQSAMAIMNGIQQVANILNKDSYLMLRLKSIWTAANTTATAANTTSTTANTVATTANTTANVANTASTVANTAAQKAWNVAKAVAKALLGDWTGLVLVGAVALGTYAIATSGATDAEDEHAKSLKNTANAMDGYNSTLQSTFAQLMTSYARLRAEWKNLSSEQAKNQWIKDNQSKLDDLNISVNNVQDAEKAFADNTPSVVKAFIARAKAAAQLALLTENYKKQMELIDKINTAQAQMTAEAASRPKVVAGQEITNSQHTNSRYGSVNAQGKWVYSEAGATLNNTGVSTTNPYMNKLQGDLKGLQSDADRIANGIAETLKDVPTITHPKSNTKTGGSKVDKKEEIAPAGSLKYYEDELARLNKELKLTPETDTSNIERLKREIADISQKKDALEIQLGIKEPKKQDAKKYAEGSIAAIKEEISKLDTRLSNENLDLPTRLDLVTQKADLQKQVDELANVGKPIKVKTDVELKLDKYDDASRKISEIVSARDAGIITPDAARQQIAEVNKALQKEKIDPIKVHIEGDFEKSFKNFASQADSIFSSIDSIDGVVNSFQNLSQAIGDGANAWEIFMGVVQAANSIIGAIGSTMETVNTIMEVLGTTTATTSAIESQAAAQEVTNSGMVVAAKSGEAIAGATASGAKMPFPANLIAIAAGIAAVVAAISMIGSFADGGIVKGNTFHGDNMIARVNAGEMILTNNQQANLFRLLDGGNRGGATGGQVEFRISGSSLKGVLNNYNNKMSKVK